MAEITVSGIPEAMKRIASLTDERMIQIATGHVMMAVREAAREESSGPARWRDGKNFPRTGGPGIVTGTHRAGIKTEGPTTSGKVTRGYVAATAPYSRGLEEGTSTHPPYSFFAPAVRTVAPKVGSIFMEHWLKAITNGQ